MSVPPGNHLYPTILGKATPDGAELTLDNSAILLRSRASARQKSGRKIASNNRAQTAAPSSGLAPKARLVRCALVSFGEVTEILLNGLHVGVTL